MTKATLKAHLIELREELAGTQTLDEHTRQLLEHVADEIEQVLAQTEPDYESLRERVEARAVDFEANHPGFARLLNEVTDALAKLGI
jgi:hypothetical protein